MKSFKTHLQPSFSFKYRVNPFGQTNES